MPPDSSDSVAAGRRMDLASFFCMVARHGPAVVLAVIAGGFLLLVFILYRSVRQRRRKALSTATERAGTDGSSGGETHERRRRTEPSPGEPERESGWSAESTDVNNLRGSNTEEDDDQFVLRHRVVAAAAAAAERKPPSPPSEGDISTAELQKCPPEPVPQQGSLGSPHRRTDEDQVHDDENGWKRRMKMEMKVLNDAKDEMLTRDVETSPKVESNVNFDQTSRLEDSNLRTEDVHSYCFTDNDIGEERQRPEGRVHHRVLTPEEEKTHECETEKLEDQQLDQVSPQKTQCEPVTVCDKKKLLVDVDVHCDVMIQTPTNTVEVKTLVSGDSCRRTTNSLGEELQRSLNVEHLQGETSEVYDSTNLSVDLHSADSDKKEMSSSLQEDLPTSALDSASTECGDNEAASGKPTDLDISPTSEDKPRGLMGNGVIDEAESDEPLEERGEPQLLQIPQQLEVCSFGLEQELHLGSTQQDQSDQETRDGLGLWVEPEVEKKEEEMTSSFINLKNEPDDVDKDEHSSPSSYSDDMQMNRSYLKDMDISEASPHTPGAKERMDLNLPTSFEVQPTGRVEMEMVTNTPLIYQKQNGDQTSTRTRFEESSSVPPEKLTLSPDPSVRTQNLHPCIFPGQTSALEQVDIIDEVLDVMSSPCVEVESGISSMTVSPDLPDVANEFGRTVEETAADDAAVFIITEATTETLLRHRDFTTFAVNEDVFGHEVEDRYHLALEEFMMQVSGNSLSSVDSVKVVELKEKKEVVRLTEKSAADTEDQTEEFYEKSEISIMEATMDNNEWITDTNVPLHPWINLSVPAFGQDIPKTDQLPDGVTQESSSGTGSDSGPYNEAKQTSSVPVVDENAEGNRKVQAVQPMPQNVNVTFRVHYVTASPYQVVAVTGNQQELGNWREHILMEKDVDGHWAAVVSLPAESHVEWKFVLVDKGQVSRWEECRNRLLYTGFGDDVTVHKLWGQL